MYSRRVPLTIAYSACLILASIILREWHSLVLLLPLASLFFFARNLFFPGETVDIEVTREVSPTRILVGETATVKLRFFNKGSRRIDLIEAHDRLAAEVETIKGTNHLLLSLDPAEEVTSTYEILCPKRGRYDIGPTTVRSMGPLKLYFDERNAFEAQPLYVIPEIQRLRPTDLRARQTGPWPGIFHSRRTGGGREFYGLRDYVRGDPLKMVNWKASARTGSLITVEHESERSTDIIIILDAGKGSHLRMHSTTLLEYCIGATGSLASLLLRLGNRVGLITQGRLRFLLPRDFGKRHYQRILNQLASVEAGESPHPIGYGLPMVFPTRPEIVLISPLMDPDMPEDIGNLRADGYNVIVISPSFSEHPQLEKNVEDRIAHQIITLERRNIIDETRRYAAVVDWDPRIPLRTAMKGIRRWHIAPRR